MRYKAHKTTEAPLSPGRLIRVAAAVLGVTLLSPFANPSANAETPAAPLGCPDDVPSGDGIAGVCVMSSAEDDSQAAGAGPTQPLQKAQEALLMLGVTNAASVIDAYRASSEQENPIAEYNLGYFYETGVGVARDPSQALVLYRRAFAHATDDRLRLVAASAIDGLEARQPPNAGPAAPGDVPAPIDIVLPVVADAVAAVAEKMTATTPPTVPPAPTTQDAAPQPTGVLPAALVAALLSRGNEMLRLGDIGTARLLYIYAANAGSGEAAIGVGKTHDARFLAQIHAIGIVPDTAAAAGWYRRAAALGDPDADRFLADFETLGGRSFGTADSR